MEFQEGQTVICEIDVYGNGEVSEYSGYVTNVHNDSVDVCYLDGYHSRSDRVKFENIVALVDETKQCSYYKTKEFSGYLIPNPLYQIKRQMLQEYSKYPLVGDYEINEEILAEDMLELSNINWDKEIED